MKKIIDKVAISLQKSKQISIILEGHIYPCIKLDISNAANKYWLEYGVHIKSILTKIQSNQRVIAGLNSHCFVSGKYVRVGLK